MRGLNIREMEEFHLAPGVTPERREECTSVEEFLSRGEPWVILYAPLTPSAFGVLSKKDRSLDDDFERAVIDLQQGYAWKLVLTAALALRGLPSLVQRRICAFAFTARALDHQ